MASEALKKMRAFNQAQRRLEESGRGAVKCWNQKTCAGKLQAYPGKGGAVVIRCNRCGFVHEMDILEGA